MSVTYEPITPSSPNWEACLAIYIGAFPPDERREPAELESMIGYPGYHLHAVLINDKIAGILETWEFEDFRFLEHIAILPQLQGKGVGTQLLNQYLSQSDKPVVLEAEPPSDPVAMSRINFYLNAGFTILDIYYKQPPYYPGKNQVPMILLANTPLENTSIHQAIKIIKQNVYGNL